VDSGAAQKKLKWLADDGTLHKVRYRPVATVMRPCAPALLAVADLQSAAAQRDTGSGSERRRETTRRAPQQLKDSFAAPKRQKGTAKLQTPSSLSHSSRRTTACRLARNKQFSATQRNATRSTGMWQLHQQPKGNFPNRSTTRRNFFAPLLVLMKICLWSAEPRQLSQPIQPLGFDENSFPCSWSARL